MFPRRGGYHPDQASIRVGEEVDQGQHPAVVIRPMGVGEVVDSGIRLARGNYRLLAVTTAWAVAPAFVIGAILDLTLNLPSVGTFALTIGSWLAGIAAVLACAHLIAPSGEVDEFQPGPLYRLARGRLWRSFLWSILVIILAIPLLILFPLGIFLGVRWTQSWTALIVEGQGPIQSLRTSWHLTRRAWWHTFGVLLVFGLIYILVLFVVSALFGAVGGLVVLAGSAAVGRVFVSLGSAVTSIFVEPFVVATQVVLYYELRARQEGFDLGSRARQQWQNPGS